MTESTSQRLSKVHDRAMRRMDAIWSAVQFERQQNYEDRRFCTIRGAQWDQWLGRTEDGDGPNTPRMEVNKTHKSVIRIFSDYRNNRISVDFRPKDVATDRETANNLDGLYRADENDSDGQAAYDNAFDEAISGGFGAWRLRADYEDELDEEDERQRIRFEPIYEADQSVFFDINAKRQDKRDAGHAFVILSYSRESAEGKWGQVSSFDEVSKPIWDYGWWPAPDVVKVAEYYEVEDRTTVLQTFENIATKERETYPEVDDDRMEELRVTGWELVSSRKVKRPRVRKYILSGAEVLEDEGYIAGPRIPIVPMYGKRWFIDGVERSMGHTRLAIDAQRILNTVVSSLTELAGTDPRNVPILLPEQVENHETNWANSERERLAYLLVNPVTDANGQTQPMGPVGMKGPAEVPPALAALIQFAGATVDDLTGESDQQEDVPSNVSAKAIELVHNRVDARNYIYMDNMRKAMKCSGEIWRGMASDLYIEDDREMMTIDGKGGQAVIKLAETAVDANGAQYLKNDLTKGKYDCVVDVGPASATRQDATVKALTGFADISARGGDTVTANACISTALSVMDGEGIDDLQDWVRMGLVRQGIIKPNDQEKAQLAKEQEAAASKPDPQAQLIQAASQQAQAEAQEAMSRAKQADAMAIKAQADALKSQAETAATYAEIYGKDAATQLKAAELRISAQNADNDRVANLHNAERDREHARELAEMKPEPKKD